MDQSREVPGQFSAVVTCTAGETGTGKELILRGYCAILRYCYFPVEGRKTLAYEMMRREQREISTLEAQKIIQGPLKLVHEETTRLYCAQTDATTVIAACLNHPTLSTPYLMLAFECHEEALLVQPTIKPQLDRILEQGAEDANPQRRKVVAETILKRRLKEMVPVLEAYLRLS